MAKKHLLYIHFDEFENEPRKSFLINTLLSEHYGKPWKTKKIPPPVPKPLEVWSGPMFRDKKKARL